MCWRVCVYVYVCVCEKVRESERERERETERERGMIFIDIVDQYDMCAKDNYIQYFILCLCI